MQPNDKEPKHGVIHSFFRSSFKKRKVVDSTSTIDTSSQITEIDEIVCCTTDNYLNQLHQKHLHHQRLYNHSPRRQHFYHNHLQHHHVYH